MYIDTNPPIKYCDKTIVMNSERYTKNNTQLKGNYLEM